VWNYSWIKWVFLAVICCYWLIWTFLAFLAVSSRNAHLSQLTPTLSFVGLTLDFHWLFRHLPPPPPRMREKETGDTELEEVNIQDIKKAAADKRMSKKKGMSAIPVVGLVRQLADIPCVFLRDLVGAGHKSKREKADNGAYLSWSNLNYSVFVRKGLKKQELQLLHDVSGYVKPGMMLALMVRALSIRTVNIFRIPWSDTEDYVLRIGLGVVGRRQVDADGRSGQAEDWRQDHRRHPHQRTQGRQQP
jgi:hypothetical protein